MNCHYCDKECETHGYGLSWTCLECRVYYYKSCMNMLTTIGHKEYCLQFIYEHDKHGTHKAELFCTDRADSLVIFDKFPDITPSNINEKVKLYLTFL